MGKRKLKNKTLTKIDPSIFKAKPQAVSQHATNDGECVVTAVELSHPSLAPESLLYPDLFDADIKNLDDEGLEDDGANEGVPKGSYVGRDNPLLQWKPERDTFLKELIWLEGRGVFTNGRLRELSALIQSIPHHRSHLLQLGHHPAEQCTNPQRSTKPFTVIHTNGIHLVDLAFCGCTEVGNHGTRVQQLLRRRLFPATTLDPQTACTFSLLKSAQLLSLQSKLSLCNYYLSIERLTDATGTSNVNDRYKEFLRTLHMWRHLRMMKCGGRSYDPTGVDGTSPRELAVLCPACPIPSVNLPPNWRSVGKEHEYLYYQSFGIDACFRFKRRQISSYEKDPELGPGYAYLVAWDAYSEYLRRFTDQREMSTCSGLAALDHANSKYSKGYATTGIVCTTCRHEFLLPEGAGPLQKGERYANTDYVVVRSTSHNLETKKVASYDIMCQWSVNLRDRLKDFPHLDAECLDDQIVSRLVPKFHLAAHKESCRVTFSLNYEPGVGRSNMEGPERTWFGLQGGGSTKDQGPGYWSDAMDDKFGHWNWSKLIHLGTLLAKKYTNALVQSATHEDEFTALCTGISSETLGLWTTGITEWELDRTKPNPYFRPSSGLSESQIRRRLSLEEENEELTSAAMGSEDDFTETKYLLYGLDLKDHRRKLQAALSSSTSDIPSTSVIELRTSYHRRFAKFRQLQPRFQPEVTPLLSQLPPTSTDPQTIQDAPLYLPSSLPPNALSECSKRLLFMEKELRIGQCRDCLVQLRTKLNALARLLKHKYVNIRHQASNTRSQDLVNHLRTKIDAVAGKYRNAFTRLQALDQDEGSEWRTEFLELRNQDVCGLSETELPNARTQERAEELQARSLLNGGVMPEGNHTVSWIWRGSLNGGPGDQGEHSEGWLLANSATLEFRLEWSKARARAARWSKEVLLLREEMRRVLAFLRWKSNDWLRNGDPHTISPLTDCPYQLEGLRAYAYRQANVFGDIHDHFLSVWKGLELPREHLAEPIYSLDQQLQLRIYNSCVCIIPEN
ncbi:hypothetical protein BJ322DRAFT_1022239 [Thelephora terrestris]|uniref:CxC2-like cysteine cluster KDZ transposase-associated domain-containing protein n=1 Tax=Thelephora terrestris TaxID=56493 RepID=A0A9P6L4S3_9AGAM|nr:hypothetical protein BJ322DRAFT_1022239 [Thelephora terrestris]